MTINTTETRLPYGYTKDDLGEAVSILSDAIVLISYQTSPLVVNYEQTYVLFITDPYLPEMIDHIEWSVYIAADRSDTHAVDFTHISDTCIRLFIEETGVLIISTEIFYTDPGAPNDILTLSQKVKTNFLEMIPKVNDDYCSFGTPTTTNYLVDNYLRYLSRLTYSAGNSYGELRFFIASLIYTTLLQNKNTFTEPYVNSILNFSSQDFTEGVGLEQLRPYLLLYLFGEITTDPETSFPPLYDELITYSKTDLNQTTVTTLFTNEYNKLSDEQKIDFYNLLRFPATCLTICRDYLAFLKDKFYPAYTFKICFDTPAKRNALINQFYMGPYDNIIDFTKSPNDYSKTILKDHSANMNKLIPAISFLKKMLFSVRYGSYKLLRNDSDTSLRYGGVTRVLADIEFTAGENGHTTTPKFINNLKNDLYLLGFNIMKSNADITANTGTELSNSSYDLHTEWAVREFQVYASMNYTAKLKTIGATAPSLGDNLESVANTLIYTGPKSGVLNDETKMIMQYWLDNNYRCPVVVSAFTMSGTTKTLHTDNIWLYNQVTDSGPRMYVKDYSRYYTGIDTASDPLLNDWIVLAYYDDAYWGGQAMSTNHSWSSCKITFDNLTGVARNTSDTTQTTMVSTYKVVHVVSKAEVHGNYDECNFYDSGLVSLGIPHWTLQYNPTGSESGGTGNELGGTLYFIKKLHSEVFETALANFGIVDADHHYNSTLLTFAGDISVETEVGNAKANYARSEITYYKNWHFVYRFVMMMRVFPGIRTFMWDFMRKRLSDVLNINLSGINVIGTTTTAKVKDVFTSEKAIAIIFRWHVNEPGTLNQSHRLSNVVIGNPAVPAENLSTSYNTAASQLLLIDRLLVQVATDSNDEIEKFPGVMDNYTDESGLSTANDSFLFFDENVDQFV